MAEERGRAKVGNKGQEVSEVWGMTFWMPVVGGGRKHVSIFRRTEGGEMSKGGAKYYRS